MDQGQKVTVIDLPYFGKLKWGTQVSIQVRKKAASQGKRIVLFQRLLKRVMINANKYTNK